MSSPASASPIPADAGSQARQPGYEYPRDALIVGGGLGGLFAATALGQRGWSVRLHEQAADLRMFGAGIWLWENGLRSLEAIGVLDAAVFRGQRMSAWEIRDHRGRLLRRRETPPYDRLIVPPRADLYEALKAGAKQAGVDIVTDSQALRADPDGTVSFADGSSERASLVVAADGLRSKLRESLGLTKSKRNLGNGAIRLLIPRLPGEAKDVAEEHWSGSRGLLYNPCSNDDVYLCMVCPQSDTEGRQLPVNKASWAASHPALASVIGRIGSEGRWDNFETVDATRWSAGRVAIVGDAAHGQPPWLGQAANLAFANCLALAEFVSGISSIEQALRAWERACRPVTDHTERWTNAYGRVVGMWPEALEDVRSLAVGAFVRAPLIETMLNRAQRSNLRGLLTRPATHGMTRGPSSE
jgi:2-polyprenyl-6-methoxyphenol hydroxylase-like FAD-dependent oxidoreductase